MTTRTLDWADAGYFWQNPTLDRVELPGVERPDQLRRAGYCVVARRPGCLRVCVRGGWYWIVGVETGGGRPARCVAVRTDVRYRGDADVIADA